LRLFSILALNQTKIIEKPHKRFLTLSPWKMANIMPDPREDCLYQTKWGVEEHIGLLKEKGLPIPKENPNPKVTIQNQEPFAKTG